MAMHRLVEQRSEMNRQLSKISEIQERHAEIARKSLTKDVEAVVSRQESLHRRADKLLQRLATNKELPISNAEKRWFLELGRLRSKIESDRGLQAQIANVSTHVIVDQKWSS